ncbi:MAG: DNA translocase FtsK, partial [Campylobacterales bacterium]|nr:DNA translocase FtsK [Campylobacterales bacterium]
MGSYGAVFAKYNHLYFGYISYVYLFLLLAPLFFIYKNFSFSFRKLELSIATLLLFFASLLAQSMLVENNFRGVLGGDFVDFTKPFIGAFGLWTFWAIITSVSILIVVDKTTSEIAGVIRELFKKKFQTLKQEKKVTQKPKEVEKKSEPVVDEVYEDEIDDDFEDEIEIKVIKREEKKEFNDEFESNNSFDEDIDKPTYLRKKKEIEVKEDKDIKDTKEDATQEELEEEIENVSQEKEIIKPIKPKTKSSVVVSELEENTKLLDSLEKGETEKPKNFKLPSVDFLQKPDGKSHNIDENELDEKIEYLIEKLAHFKIDGDVVRTYAGPVVSTFEFKPAANVKVSKILNLQDDLAMALSAETIRIQAPIPGKDVVGIEIPNDSFETIYLRELLDSKIFKEAASPLTIALGKDIVGKPFITDLKKLPHLLIAGTTGSGKSVGINAMILSLLYKNSPDQLRLLMIDPKMLEFSIYNDIPHLLTPVITKPKQAIVALNNMVNEMERRYELMAEAKTKNIENYNEK